MSDNLDFGELANDTNLKNKVLDLKNNLAKVSSIINTLFATYIYDDLSFEDKVRYDLFVAFAINTLFWMYLRIKGIDTSSHEIKDQINRVREYMAKSKRIYEKKTIMPKIDKGAAQRFVRSGLWTANSSYSVPSSSTSAPAAKRQKTH